MRFLYRAIAFLVGLVAVLVVPLAMTAVFTGAIYTTDAACGGVNLNLFASKSLVYLYGGPNGGGSGLPDGSYYVRVTEPGGSLLGTSVGAADPMPAVVVGGVFVQCYQLGAIVIKASDSTPGYDTSSSNGEYKVWISAGPTFGDNQSKTDDFRVIEDNPPVPARINVVKFYDANANGLNDDGQLISGWQVNIQDSTDRYTPVTIYVAPDEYTVTESMPIQTNWMSTTPNPVVFTIGAGGVETVTFGNLCLGAGGGRTLGFWSNKNGQKLFGADDLTLMNSLNLRGGPGQNYDPATSTAFRSWLLNANTINMAYMLSAQLAAMELNVFNGNANGGALNYAPGTNSANALGFATLNAVMAEANAELGLHGLTPSGSPYRAYQEALKNALDNANNNKNFVHATPCPFSF